MAIGPTTMRRVLAVSALLAGLLLLGLPSLGHGDPCMPGATAVAGTWTASACPEEEEEEAGSWTREETFTDKFGRQIALRRGNDNFGRIHIQNRRGWPAGQDGTPVRQNTIDTLANPSTVEMQGTANVYSTPSWRVVVETAADKGTITSYPILP